MYPTVRLHPIAFLTLYALCGASAAGVVLTNAIPGIGIVLLISGVVLAAVWYERWVAVVAAVLFEVMLLPVVLRLDLNTGSVVGFLFSAAVGLLALVTVLNYLVVQRRASQFQERAAQLQLQRLLTDTPAVLYQLVPDRGTHDYHLSMLSPNAKPLLGRGPDALRPHPLLTGLCGTLAATEHRIWRDRLEREGEATIEYAYRHPDGRMLWLRDSSRLLRDTRGDVGDIMGSVVDLTAEHRIAVRASEQERELAQVLRYNPAVLFRALPAADLAHGWHFVFNSVNVLDVVGYSVDELREDGALWVNRIHPDDRLRVAQAARVAALEPGSGGPIVYDYRFRHRDGRWIWLQDTLQILRDESGRPVEMYGQSLDVTERQSAVEALTETRRQLDEVLRQSPALLYRAVPDSTQATSWQVTFTSPNTERLTGFRASELLLDQSIWPSRIHPADVEKVLDLRRSTRHTLVHPTAPLTVEYRFRHRDGLVLWFQETLRLSWDPAGHPIELIGHVVDISARKHAEVALADMITLLGRMTDALPGAMYVLDVTAADGQGVFVYATRYLPDLLGYIHLKPGRREDVAFLGKVLHPDDRGQWHSDRSALVSLPDGQVLEREYRVRAADGTWRWLHARFLVFSRGESGLVREILGTLDDTSALHQAQADLADSQRLLNRVAQAVPSMLYVIDLKDQSVNGGMVYSNRSLPALLGFPVELAHPQGWSRFILEQLQPDLLPHVADAQRRWRDLRDGEVIETDYRLRDATGNWRWMRGRDLVFERDRQGAVSQVIGVLEDITASQELQNEIQIQRDFAQLVLNALGQGVAVFNSAGLCEYINPAGARILGIETAAAIGSDLIDSLSTDVYRDFLSQLNRQAPDWPIQTLEIGLQLADGPAIDLFVTGTDRFQDGQKTGVIVVFSNVTERKALERQLATTNIELERALAQARALTQEAQDLTHLAQAATRAKSEFLANMSHEIRTPLNAIVGLAELVMDSSPTSEQHARVQVMIDSSQALLQIINDILDFSKIEAGRVDLDRHAFQLTPLVESVVELLAVRAQPKGLRLSAFVDPALPATLIGDSGRVRQILVNLVSNAVKFTSEGHVAVRVERESSAVDSVQVRFSIQDSGIGIEPEAQTRLFQPFEQADPHTTRRFGGTGLGLALVKRLVDLMGGAVQLASQPGAGTTVTLRLTFGIAAVDPAPINPGTRARRVLIAEPDAVQCEILERYLGAAGHTCRTLADPSAVLAHLRQDSDFDVLILGVWPTLAETEHLRARLDADPVLSRLRRIVIANELRADGGDERWLKRPIQRGSLLACIDSDPAGDWGPRLRAAPVETQAVVVTGPLHRLRVLLAEDNAVNQQVARLQLDKLGYDVEVVDTGAAAVSAYEAAPTRYDRILMDCLMPVMDGFEATRTIRAWEADQSPPCHIQIIAMTANAMAGDREVCLAAGMDDYVSKPVSRQALSDVLVRPQPARPTVVDR